MNLSNLKIETIFLLLIGALLAGVVGAKIEGMFFSSSAINAINDFSIYSVGFLVGFIVPMLFGLFSQFSNSQIHKM
jgi:ABC-type antimicrobial peptide transport system permease subunit